MASRRDVLMGGGVAALGLALAPAPVRAAGQPAQPVRPALLIADTTIAAEVADTARRIGMPVADFVGDIAVPWLERLEPMRRGLPQPVAGVTYGGAFFCLEQLARTCGLACTLRISPPWPGRGQLAGPGAEMAASVLNGRNGSWPNGVEAPDRPLVWLLQPIVPDKPRG